MDLLYRFLKQKTMEPENYDSNTIPHLLLTLIWVGFLGVRFEVERG